MPMLTAPYKLYDTPLPRPADMADYLSRIRAVSTMIAHMPGTPDPPENMDNLGFQAANDIESALIGAERAIHALEESFIYSGETTAGGY